MYYSFLFTFVQIKCYFFLVLLLISASEQTYTHAFLKKNVIYQCCMKDTVKCTLQFSRFNHCYCVKSEYPSFALLVIYVHNLKTYLTF